MAFPGGPSPGAHPQTGGCCSSRRRHTPDGRASCRGLCLGEGGFLSLSDVTVPGWHLPLYALRGHPATHEKVDVSRALGPVKPIPVPRCGWLGPPQPGVAGQPHRHQGRLHTGRRYAGAGATPATRGPGATPSQALKPTPLPATPLVVCGVGAR
jgi:hypothetical protein